MSGCTQQLLKERGSIEVIAINEGNIIALSRLDAHIACHTRASVMRCLQVAEAGIASRKGPSHFDAAVSAMIVDEQHLKVLHRLRLQALERLAEVGFDVVDRDDDTDSHANLRLSLLGQLAMR